jgi:hypothetical protein
MMGVPKILVPQENIVEVELLVGMSPSQGPTVLGNPVPRDKNELRPSTRILRK